AAAKPISAQVLIPPPPAVDNSQAGTVLASGLGSRLDEGLAPSNSAPAADPNNSVAASLAAQEDRHRTTAPPQSRTRNSTPRPRPSRPGLGRPGAARPRRGPRPGAPDGPASSSGPRRGSARCTREAVAGSPTGHAAA